MEIILVDDGSTDGTAAYLQTVIARSPAPRGGTTKQSQTKIASPTSGGLATTSIRYIFQPNQGPAAARNAGILQARGEFVAFLDSDDEWLPGKLEAQLRYFRENPDSLICQTEEIWIRKGKRVNPMKKHKKEGGWIFERSLELCLVSPSAVMVRRKFFDEVGLFDESFPACEDYELWLRASARFPIGLVEKPYVNRYGGHPDQRSREFPVMDGFRIQALQKILESGVLNPGQKEAALRELRRKCEIVSKGALKRGKIEEAKYYTDVIARARSARSNLGFGIASSGLRPSSQ